MKQNLVFVCLLVSLGFSLTAARAGTVVYDFNGGNFGDLVKTNDTGFSASVGSGVLTLSNTAGAGNGTVNLVTPFSVTGDFTAFVDGNRTGIGSSEIGVASGSDSSALGNIFFQRANVVASNMFRPFVHTVFQDSNNSATMRLTITRTGNTVTTIYNAGSGDVTHSESDPSLAGPVKLQLFLLEEFGDNGAHTGTLDNFTITSASIPEPASVGLLVLPGALLMARRRRREHGSRASASLIMKVIHGGQAQDPVPVYRQLVPEPDGRGLGAAAQG